MEQIWLVDSGDGEGVVAVAASEAMADAVAKVAGCGHYGPVPLYADGDPLPRSVTLWRCRISAEGTESVDSYTRSELFAPFREYVSKNLTGAVVVLNFPTRSAAEAAARDKRREIPDAELRAKMDEYRKRYPTTAAHG